MKIIVEHDLYRDQHQVAVFGEELGAFCRVLLSQLADLTAELKRANDIEGLDDEQTKRIKALAEMIGGGR